ncbi:hypothetical protein MMC14_009000 [Varicellaria rhodocarpa]|nr:hypothetical protein [Varicellaria rhodocarpa]
MARELRPSSPESIASTGNSAKSPRNVQSIVTGSRDSNGSKQSRIDPTNTNYRSDVLALNRVVFKSTIDPLPENVVAVVNKILVRCESPEIDNATATKIRDKIIQLGEDAEAELRDGFLTMDILPPKAVDKKLKRTQQMPFKNATLPRGDLPRGLPVAIQTICEPRPDVTYSYTL